jgi:acyl carrier protein
MQGYFGDPEATAEALDPDGWLDTGDVGYMAEGDLVIVGRAKDTIIVNGRNVWPQDLEWLVEQNPAVRTQSCAAFGIREPGLGERAVVLVQSGLRDPAERAALCGGGASGHPAGDRARLPDRARAAAQPAPDLLRQAEPQPRARALPRGRLRDGRPRRPGRRAGGAWRRPAGRGGAMTLETLYGVIARVKPPEKPLTPETRFVDDLGFDSLTVMELVAEVEDTFDINLPINLLPEIHTVGELAATIDRLRSEQHE